MGDVYIRDKRYPDPFRMTMYIAILTVLFSLFTLTLGGRLEWFVVLVTGPFNIAIEQNVYGNLFIALLIMAVTELYLKSTGRALQVEFAFVSSILSSYILSAYSLFTGGGGGTGTSIMAFSTLLFLIIVIVYDLIMWIKENLLHHITLLNLAKAAGFAYLAGYALWYATNFLVFGYLVNPYLSAGTISFHLWGGFVSMLILFPTLWITKLGLKKKDMEQEYADEEQRKREEQKIDAPIKY